MYISQETKKLIVFVSGSILIIGVVLMCLYYAKITNKNYDEFIKERGDEIFTQCAEKYAAVPKYQKIIPGANIVNYQNELLNLGPDDYLFHSKEINGFCEVELQRNDLYSVELLDFFPKTIASRKINVILFDLDLIRQSGVYFPENQGIILQIEPSQTSIYAKGFNLTQKQVISDGIGAWNNKNELFVYYPSNTVSDKNIIGFITYDLNNEIISSKLLTIRLLIIPNAISLDLMNKMSLVDLFTQLDTHSIGQFKVFVANHYFDLTLIYKNILSIINST